MILFLIYHYNDYYIGDPFIYQNHSTRITTVYSDLFITFCSFFSISNSAIYFSGSILNLLVENCLFHSCITSGRGGGIFFSGNGNFICNKICGYNCYSSSSTRISGHFLLLSTGTNNNNECHMSSMLKCPYFSNIHYSVIQIGYGKQKMNNLNFSLNTQTRISSFQSHYANTYSAKFCTICNNIVSDQQCLNFHAGTGRYVSYFNIITNNSPTGGVILLSENPGVVMEFCIFIDNKNILFFVVSGSLTIKNSNIVHTGTLNSGAVVFNSNKGYKSTYILDHYLTNLCHHETNLILPTPTECFIFTHENLKINILNFLIYFILY